MRGSLGCHGFSKPSFFLASYIVNNPTIAWTAGIYCICFLNYSSQFNLPVRLPHLGEVRASFGKIKARQIEFLDRLTSESIGSRNYAAPALKRKYCTYTCCTTYKYKHYPSGSNHELCWNLEIKIHIYLVSRTLISPDALQVIARWWLPAQQQAEQVILGVGPGAQAQRRRLCRYLWRMPGRDCIPANISASSSSSVAAAATAAASNASGGGRGGASAALPTPSASPAVTVLVQVIPRGNTSGVPAALHYVKSKFWTTEGC